MEALCSEVLNVQRQVEPKRLFGVYVRWRSSHSVSSPQYPSEYSTRRGKAAEVVGTTAVEDNPGGVVVEVLLDFRTYGELPESSLRGCDLSFTAGRGTGGPRGHDGAMIVLPQCAEHVELQGEEPAADMALRQPSGERDVLG